VCARSLDVAAIAITSVDIDSDMLRLAKISFDVCTNREAINLALRDVVMRDRERGAIDAIAKIPVDRVATTITYGD